MSSDAFRAMVSDDENDQAATPDAFDALHYLASIRLRRRKLVAIDATNVQAEARKSLIQLADRHDCLSVAIVLNVPEAVCQERNKTRPDRQFGQHVVRNQSRQLHQSLRNLKREGFRHVFILNEEQIANAQISRTPLWTDRRTEKAPFDLIGDVHGCYDELTELLGKLGYLPNETGGYAHPEGRRVVFLGDLVDRGNKVVETVRLAMGMMAAGTAICVPGNHDDKLKRALQGKKVTVSHGLADSLAQIEALPEEERETFKTEYVAFADGLISHAWLDDGNLCAAHAGMKEEYIGRASGRVREFALYGETTGESDEFGLPSKANPSIRASNEPRRTRGTQRKTEGTALDTGYNRNISGNHIAKDEESMATLSIRTQLTVDDFVEAAEQLSTPELEKLARRLLQIQARRKAPNLSQREAELIEGIAQTSTFDPLPRLLFLTQEMERRALSQNEQNELNALAAQSEELTAKRLALLIELSQLRRISLPTLMKQLKIKAPEVV